MGGNSGMMVRLGNSMPKASNRPKSAPEAPTVGTLEPASSVITNWLSAATSTAASRNCQYRRLPHICSSSEPNIHNPSMLKNRCSVSPCRKA